MHATARKKPRERFREKTLRAAIMAVERLQQLLRDEATSNADVIRAATLVFDRLAEEKGESAMPGDFEIVLRDGG